MLTEDGEVFGFGSNQTYEMGIADGAPDGAQIYREPKLLELLSAHRVKKVRSGLFSACLTEKDDLILWGTGAFGCFQTPQKVCVEGVAFVDVQISKGDSREGGFMAA